MDICLIDDAFGYLEFAEAFSEMIDTGHIAVTLQGSEKFYAVTEKGRDAATIFEQQLPAVIRERAQHAAIRVAKEIRRADGIHTETATEPDGLYSVRLKLAGEEYDVFDLKIAAVNESQCKLIERNFKKHAEKIYYHILTTLLDRREDSDQ